TIDVDLITLEGHEYAGDAAEQLAVFRTQGGFIEVKPNVVAAQRHDHAVFGTARFGDMPQDLLKVVERGLALAEQFLSLTPSLAGLQLRNHCLAKGLTGGLLRLRTGGFRLVSETGRLRSVLFRLSGTDGGRLRPSRDLVQPVRGVLELPRYLGYFSLHPAKTHPKQVGKHRQGHRDRNPKQHISKVTQARSRLADR